MDFVAVCLFRFLRYALHNPMVEVWSSNNKKGKRKERKKERKEERKNEADGGEGTRKKNKVRTGSGSRKKKSPGSSSVAKQASGVE